MRVLLRVDSSRLIGTGHLFRCLTLAQELRDRGAAVAAVCRDLPGNMAHAFSAAGFELNMLPAPGAAAPSVTEVRLPHADWLGTTWEQDAEETLGMVGATGPTFLVVDHYALDHRWEAAVAADGVRVLAIDDIADRSHRCDLLLDQNLHAGMDQRYADLVPSECRLLLGPRFALLRPEFRRRTLRQRDGSIRRIMVSLGGVDLTHQTQKALAALRALGWSQRVDVIIGGANTGVAAIRQAAAELPAAALHFNLGAQAMVEMMEDSDLAIGAPGTSTWERCALGLPAITMATAQNQVSIGQAAAAAGVLCNLGWHADVTTAMLEAAIRSCMMDPVGMRQMSAAGRALVDGSGAPRVADAMEAAI